jgi:hypothetical protein
VREGRKRYDYKECAKRTYSYYVKYGVTGIVSNGWNWLLNKPERLTALSTFAIFLATAALIGVGIAQWKTLKATDFTTRQTSRAFVYFEDAVLISYPNPPQKAVTYAIITKMTNSGTTPARNVKIGFSCPPRDAQKSKIDPYDLEPFTQQFDPPTFMGPKQNIVLIACNLPLTLIDDIKNGTERFMDR